MTTIRTIAASLLFSAVIIAPAGAQPKPGNLDLVLHQLDESAAKFRSAEADLRWDFYERVVKETTTQTGSIFVKREGGQTIMGAKLLPPSARFLEYRDNFLRIYDPGTNHITIISTKDNQAQAESLLTLGFGGSGTDLAKAWTISDLGSEMISDGDKMVYHRQARPRLQKPERPQHVHPHHHLGRHRPRHRPQTTALHPLRRHENQHLHPHSLQPANQHRPLHHQTRQKPNHRPPLTSNYGKPPTALVVRKKASENAENVAVLKGRGLSRAISAVVALRL